MTMDEFHTTLWDLTHPKPGRPFTVELTDGRRFEIRPGGALAHQHGYANYLHFEDKVLHRFHYQQVKSISEQPADASGANR